MTEMLSAETVVIPFVMLKTDILAQAVDGKLLMSVLKPVGMEGP